MMEYKLRRNRLSGTMKIVIIIFCYSILIWGLRALPVDECFLPVSD